MPAFSRPPERPRENVAQERAAAFVALHQQGLWRFLRAAGCAAGLAEELTQDALLVALRRGIVDRDRPAAAAFLRTTARHLWLRRQRDERRQLARLLDVAELLWQRDCGDQDGGELLAALDACVAALPARSQHVLRRVYSEDASRRDLATELGLGEHGARTLLQRLRKALRECVERRMS